MKSVLSIVCWWVGRVCAWVTLVLLAAKVSAQLICWLLVPYGGCTVPATAHVVISYSEARRYV